MKEHQIFLYIPGCLLIFLSFLMLLPAFAECLSKGDDWPAFLVSSLVTLSVGGCLFLSQEYVKIRPPKPREIFGLVTILWFSMAAFSALPFCLSRIRTGYTDAFFEAMSGLTTTGATVLTGLEQMPRGILLWRTFLHGVGGIGIVVMAVVVLPFLRVGGMQLFGAETTQGVSDAGRMFPLVSQVACNTIAAYLGLILLCTLAYVLVGLGLFDATTLAVSTVSTGGFVNYSGDDFFGSRPALMWTASLFMTLSSMPFLGHTYLWKGNFADFFRKQPQIQGLLSVALFSSALLVVWLLFNKEDYACELALRTGVFHVLSVLSTTGFVAEDFSNGWGHFPTMVFFLLLFVGGCTGSSSGGIKIFRFQVLIKVTRLHIRRMLFPHSLYVPCHGGRVLQPDVVFSVFTLIVAFLAVFLVSSLLLSLTGMDVLTAMSSAAQAASNVGVGLGDVVGPGHTFQLIPGVAKWVLAITMMLGRLEILTVFVFLWHFARRP